MFGKGYKYTRLESNPFELPSQLLVSDCQIHNERHFIEFLLRNDWIQRKVGIKMNESNGLFPDINGEIYDGTGDRIAVEVEFWAENYKTHNHPYRGCDLILSFYRTPDTRFVKGIPVWSFYECFRNDRWGLLSLYGDIHFDFAGYSEEGETESFDSSLSLWEKARLRKTGRNASHEPKNRVRIEISDC